jgi:hypothetical protein
MEACPHISALRSRLSYQAAGFVRLLPLSWRRQIRSRLSPDFPRRAEREVHTGSSGERSVLRALLEATSSSDGESRQSVALMVIFTFPFDRSLHAQLPSFDARFPRITFNPNDFRTGLIMLTIDHNTIRNALQRCKARQTTFTGLLNHLIARSLSENVSAQAFAAQIVVDLRHLFQDTYANNTMTNSVSAYNETVPRATTTESKQDWTDPSSDIWTAARKTSAGLKEASGTLHNQPIGLLAYLKEFRPWTLGQIGKRRECSYEISNLVVFDPLLSPPKSAVAVEKTIFSQPANAAGPCLSFNLVSTKGGPLVMTATWQRGVLDLGQDGDEDEFVRKICSSIESLIVELAAAPL